MSVDIQVAQEFIPLLSLMCRSEGCFGVLVLLPDGVVTGSLTSRSYSRIVSSFGLVVCCAQLRGPAWLEVFVKRFNWVFRKGCRVEDVGNGI